MIRFIHHLCEVMRFIQLPKAQRRITFYSEGKNYWPHLERLVLEILTTSNISVCYISSGKDDPGLFFRHKNYKTFKVDEGFIRNWLFENIDTDVMVMTMPDLHQYQVKRSKHKVHYVYVQHSLVSMHMIYRKGAFDHYDTIFCSGPHHMNEIRAIEAKYNLPQKNLVKHGYGRLDTIIEKLSEQSQKHKSDITHKHVLIAPTWGPEGTIESGTAEKIVDKLLTNGFRVTLRPHPQTIKYSKDKLDNILIKHLTNKLFHCENNVVDLESFHNSDVMISDWSGAALEYAFGLNKPVIFLDIQKKINNKDYKEVQIEPLEISIRKKIGQVVHIEDREFISKIMSVKYSFNAKNIVYNIGQSSKIGATELKALCSET